MHVPAHEDGQLKLIERKEETEMKSYLAPQITILGYTSEEAVAAPLDGSKTFNDGELEW